MGLDMYLTAEQYISPYDDAKKPISDGIKFALGLESSLSVTEIKLRAAYWRKANHIHRWFVDNVQGGEDKCEPHDVDRAQLVELRALCHEVLADRSKAAELLPTQEGFFFGGTEYDDWYFDDLKDTIKQLDEALKLPLSWGFEYESSW